MKECIMLEFSRVLKSKRTLASLVFLGGIVLWHIISEVIPFSHFGNYGEDHISLYRKWIGMDYISVQLSVYYFLLPLAISFPYGGSLRQDIDNHYIYQIVTRCGKKKYIKSKFFVSFITSGVLAIFPLVLDFILTALFLPALSPQSSTFFYGQSSDSFLGDFFFIYPLGYVVVYLIWNFLFLGLNSALSISATLFIDKEVTCIFLPFLLYWLSYVITSTTQTLTWCPFVFLMPAQIFSFYPLIPILELLFLLLCNIISYHLLKKREFI